MRPHRQQPIRLHCPWDSPGKNTGVGCHCLLQGMKVKSESEVAQSCLTLSDPMDCSPPSSSVHGIFQARVLEWGAIAFSSVFPSIRVFFNESALRIRWPNYWSFSFSISPSEGGNRQNRLHLESRIPSWNRLWTLSYKPSIYGNDIPTGKADPSGWKSPRAYT